MCAVGVADLLHGSCPSLREILRCSGCVLGGGRGGGEGGELGREVDTAAAGPTGPAQATINLPLALVSAWPCASQRNGAQWSSEGFDACIIGEDGRAVDSAAATEHCALTLRLAYHHSTQGAQAPGMIPQTLWSGVQRGFDAFIIKEDGGTAIGL